MKIFLQIAILITGLSLICARTHDEVSKCTLTGVHRTRQTVLQSPNYPGNYTPATCMDYVIRSPYRCPTKFHIQFLDFYLEASKDCDNDYLAIGLDNVDDDMDVLCGQVVGIKKYHTPDGVLRLRFFADDSPWSTGKGFNLLITRLACERDGAERRKLPDDDDDDTITVTTPKNRLQPPEAQIMALFRNLSGFEQHQSYAAPPQFGFNYPLQLPSPPYPPYGGSYLPLQQVLPQQNFIGSTQNTLEKPCTDNKVQTQQPQQPQQSYLPLYASNPQTYLPASVDQYAGTWPTVRSAGTARDGLSTSVEACCTSGFQQKRFYLSSPGFPRTVFSNLLPYERRDCEFQLQKFSASVCRIRVDFKFFDFGQNFQSNAGVPGLEPLGNTCNDDYIEIDHQRFCGCRSDYVYNGFWNYQGDKKLRMRMGYSGVSSGGFLLEISQEECSETQFSTSTMVPTAGPISSPNRLFQNNGLGSYQTTPGYLTQQPGLSQHAIFAQQQQQQQQQQHQLGLSQQLYPSQLQQFGQQQQQPNQNAWSQQSFYNSQGLYSNPHQNPLLQQQQQQQISDSIYQGYPGYPGYQQPFATPNPLQPNPFAPVNQLRYARSYSDTKYPSQPVTVVETNSTRKEYYYSDGDNTYNDDPHSISRSSRIEGVQRWDEGDGRANADVATVRRKCTFDMGDILRLSVDVMWLTKPTCYAPRGWLSNLWG